MRRILSALALVLLLLTGAPHARAQSDPDVVTPADIALVSPIHIVHGDRKLIAGLSLNLLYGQTWRMYGLEIGAVNHELDAQVGLQLGLVNVVEGDQAILQIGALVNVVGRSANGIQLSGLWNHAQHGCRGLCLSGLGNTTDHAVVPLAGDWSGPGEAESGGLMLSMIGNFLGGHFVGMMISTMNFGAFVGGAQIGVWNTALLGMDGVQIGVANINGSLLTDRREYGNMVETRTQFYRNAHDHALLVSLFNASQRFTGVAIGLINMASSQAEGVQLGGFNFSDTIDSGVHPFLTQLGAVNGAQDMAGVQLGVVNWARDVDGVQIGALNIARKLRGVQIGGIHIAYESPIPFLVGVNVGW
ncbi:MAG: hypothetical protein K8H88_23210 [Sandaracinaceae bacterium]|nr:hypothetical protein [Sandaracinaceae bacterium]